MRRRTAVLILCFLAVSFLVSSQQSERRTALVIGNADYGSSPLENPVNDARDMAETLRELGFSAMIRTNADQQEMWNAIRDFGNELVKGGVGLFYYAGHGMQVRGRNYLIPVNADIRAEDEVKFFSVDAGLALSKYEVTQKQWREVMGTNPSHFKGDDLQVEQVSWDDAVEYCNRLSRREGLTPCYSGSSESIACDFSANGYRLPTEAEWEYAARGGNKSRGYKYAGSNSAGDVVWYDGNSGDRTYEVGRKRPNELDLYDLSGNVWEWCWDWYGEYSSSSQTDPRGPSSASARVIRGGSWYDYARDLRAAGRFSGAPWYGGGSRLGIRPVSN